MEKKVYSGEYIVHLICGLEFIGHKYQGHVGQGQISIPNKGRWAHNNVKLLYFFSNRAFLNASVDLPFKESTDHGLTFIF